MVSSHGGRGRDRYGVSSMRALLLFMKLHPHDIITPQEPQILSPQGLGFSVYTGGKGHKHLVRCKLRADFEYLPMTQRPNHSTFVVEKGVGWVQWNLLSTFRVNVLNISRQAHHNLSLPPRGRVSFHQLLIVSETEIFDTFIPLVNFLKGIFLYGK